MLLYEQEVDAILAGDRNALAGIDVLRKICNHPDLLQRASWQSADPYGAPQRSGKLLVTIKARVEQKSFGLCLMSASGCHFQPTALCRM